MTSRLKLAHKIFSAVSFSILWLFSSSILAQNTFNLTDLGEGELILNLNANEQTSVEQDTLNITMQFSAQGRNSTSIQNEVNQAIRDAQDILQATDNIDYSIQQYHVYNVQPPRQNRNDIDNPVWRAQQNIQMQSMNSEALLVVTARLQQAGLTVSNMYYSLSDSKYQEVADSLLEAALLNLQTQADRVAGILDKNNADLVEVNINGSQNFFGAQMARAEFRASADMAMAVPVAEPGSTQVNVNVSARALLSP